MWVCGVWEGKGTGALDSTVRQKEVRRRDRDREESKKKGKGREQRQAIIPEWKHRAIGIPKTGEGKLAGGGATRLLIGCCCSGHDMFPVQIGDRRRNTKPEDNRCRFAVNEEHNNSSNK